MLLTLWLGLAQAAPTCPSNHDVVADSAALALAAYAEDDLGLFFAVSTRLDQELACLMSVLEPDEVTLVVLVGLAQARSHPDLAETMGALRTLTEIAPGLDPTAALPREDQSLPRMVDWLDPTPQSDPLRLPLVPWGFWQVNGAAANGHVPTDRAVVLQLLVPRENRVETWWLPEGGLPPEHQDGGARPPAENAGLLAVDLDALMQGPH